MFDPKMIALSALLPLGLGAAMPATAQDGPGRGAEMFAQLDADGSGTLSLEELQAGPDRRFDAADANGDGALTRDEMLAHAIGRAEASVDRFFAETDLDGDGAITQAERTEARDARIEERRGQMAERIFDRIDADGNGVISADEFAEAAERMGERFGRGGPGGHRG